MRKSLDQHYYIPDQDHSESLPNKRKKLSQWQEAAWCISRGRAVLMQNGGVWALLGDAENPAFIEEVNKIKERDPSRTYGLMSSFEESLEWVDFDRIKDPRVVELLLDSEKTVDLFGALGFLRMPVDDARIKMAGVPECVISRDSRGLNPLVQIYDPTGKCDAATLYQTTRQAGQRFIAITSANRTSEPEIARDDVLRAIALMANTQPLMLPYSTDGSSTEVIPIYDDNSKEWCGNGSYFIAGVVEKDRSEPYAEVGDGGFTLLREGNIATTHVQQLLFDYGINVHSPTLLPRKPQYRPYEHEGLFENATYGPDVRRHILDAFDWQK